MISPLFFKNSGLASRHLNSKCFVCVCVCLGCFLVFFFFVIPFSRFPPFAHPSLSLSSGWATNQYLLLCALVSARGRRRRRKASLRECSRLVFRIYRSAPEFLLLLLFLITPPTRPPHPPPPPSRLFNQPNQSRRDYDLNEWNISGR